MTTVTFKTNSKVPERMQVVLPGIIIWESELKRQVPEIKIDSIDLPEGAIVLNYLIAKGELPRCLEQLSFPFEMRISTSGETKEEISRSLMFGFSEQMKSAIPSIDRLREIINELVQNNQ